MTVVAAQLRRASAKGHQDAAKALAARLQGIPGVTLGGTDVSFAEGNQTVQRDLRRAELFALPILMVLLLLFFRGVVAALLPLTLGGMAILLTDLALRVASGLTSISVFTLSLVSALGVGLAIDYSLLIVSRFREELAGSPRCARCRHPHDGHGRPYRAVQRDDGDHGDGLAAGAAPAGLLLDGYRRRILTALLVCIAALTIMPALLLLLGHRVNALSPPWLQRSAGTISRPVLAGRWYRLAMAVMRRPVTVAVCASAFLLLLALPVLDIKLPAIGSATALPTSTSTRQVSDTIAANFKLDPEHVIDVTTTHATDSQLRRYTRTLERLPGEVAHSPFLHLNKQHVAVMYIEPKGEAASPQAQQLVRRIRDIPVPFERKVGGPAATFIDMKATMISTCCWC